MIKSDTTMMVEKRVGETTLNNMNEVMYISEYYNSKNITVVFKSNGYTVYNTTYQKFKLGSIKNPETPIIFGSGYIGIGQYTARINGSKTDSYNKWYSMLRRVYGEDVNKKSDSYNNVSICKKWLNYQNFAQFYNDNYYSVGNEIMALDKDILNKGNKLYSKDNCVFVPTFINSIFIRNRSKSNNLPIGVSNFRSKKYIANISKNKSKIHLGIFDTPEEAFFAYKKAKESYIKQVADEYKSQIPLALYTAMYNWKVEITD